MKKQRSNLGYELDKLFWKCGEQREKYRQSLQNFVNALCKILGLKKAPIIVFCEPERQAECITNANLRGIGKYCRACYNSGKIYIKSHYVDFDTLLHELFHFINDLDDPKAINEIMWSWYRRFYDVKSGFRKILREALNASS